MDPRQRLHMMDLLRSMAADGRTILFSSHILEEVERLADSVLVVYAGRLAAAGDFRVIRRLMTDRPHTFTRPLVRRSAAGVGAHRRRRRCSARSSSTAASPIRTADYAGFTRALPRVARDAAVSLFEVAPDRRFARERLQLPGAPMTVVVPLVEVTLRGLLGRRRTILLVLLAGAAGPRRAPHPRQRRPPGRRPRSSTRSSSAP